MTECEHTEDGNCDRKEYLGEQPEVVNEDYLVPCHRCDLNAQNW